MDIDVVSLAVSARRAGYQVYAVGYFDDQNLKTYAITADHHQAKNRGNLRTGWHGLLS